MQDAPASAGAAPGDAPIGVTPSGPVRPIQFVCDFISAEDFAIVPGAQWIIASGNREGGRLHPVGVRDKTAAALLPAGERNERFDAAAYPTSPGRLNLEKPDAFRAYGLYLEPGQHAVHTLYVVHQGTRESIEIFEVDVRSTPALTWVGCASPRRARRPETCGRTRAARDRSGVRQRGQRAERPGDLAGRAMAPSSSPPATPTRTSGRLGPREPLRETSNVAKIDTEMVEGRRIFQHPAIDGFVTATTTVQIGNEMWLGTQRGERIAYFPAPE